MSWRCPVAIASFLVIAWQLRGKLGGPHIDLENMDVIDANAEDVRFLQASRHGEVMTPVELIEGHAAEFGEQAERVLGRLRGGESLGIALIRADVSEPTRRSLLAHFVSEDLADGLDRHYVYAQEGSMKTRSGPSLPSTKCSPPWHRFGSAPRRSARSR